MVELAPADGVSERLADRLAATTLLVRVAAGSCDTVALRSMDRASDTVALRHTLDVTDTPFRTGCRE